MIRTELIAPIGALMRRQVNRRHSAPAFADRNRAITYGDLDRRTARLAIHLETLGVGSGDRVAVFLPNSVICVEAILAIVRAGAVAVPISRDASDDEIGYRLADAGCVAVFAEAGQTSRVASLTSDSSRVRLVCDDPDDLPAIDGRPRDPSDTMGPAFIVYTSGTTGKAKGVVLTLHGMLWVTAACWSPIAGLSSDDRVLAALPLYHSYALNLLVVSVLATGASAYVVERFSPADTLSLVETQRLTVLPGVPTVFHYLLDTAKARGIRSLGSVRMCLSAGAVLAGTLNRDFEQHFGLTLLDGYGITETSTMVTLNSAGGTRIMGSCGLPLPGLTARVVDLQDRDTDPDQEGELIVRGPNVMLGYHGKPEASAEALRAGWYRTGDLAKRDVNGFLTITGRLKEVIIRGGQNISPVEVEEVIASFPAVLDCAVIGAPHEFLGEVPAAFVIPRHDHAFSPEALLAYCRQHLSSYKVPDSVRVLSAIPRTGSGKVMRFRLKAQLTET